MSIRTRLERFINHKYTDITIAVLILLSIMFLILETIWERSGNKLNYHFCILANDIITVIFIAELYTRFYTYRKKTRFLKNYWLDILAVLPVLCILRMADGVGS